MTIRKAGMFLTTLAVAVGIAAAQQSGGDPPSRVARLNYIQGQVSFRPGSVEEWTNATLNYPLYNGDHLWADQGGQTELHIGSTALRMGSETALSILNLDDRMVQLSLTSGFLNVHLRALGEGESFEVDTPNSAITLLRTGDYRVQVDDANSTTVVTVHSGDAEVTGGGHAFAVHARETARLMGMDDSLSNVVGSEMGYDSFDRWCMDRDRREDQSQSVRYVGRETIGYEDLDANGTWRDVPEYGMVWSPRVVAGWAPYRYGHWAWVEPWGWTWVDDASWGFAPFHYGRWAMYGGGWVWVPGTVVARPVYAPALVAFVGGSRFSLAVSFGGGGGGVAWFPLGPREVYRPAYHVSDVYVRQVNITHVNVTNINVTNVNVTNVRYVNQNVNGAVTAVPQAAFVGARSVHTSAVAVPASAVAQAQVVGSAAVAPERASVLGRSGPAGNVAAPPARMTDRAVFAKTTPPPPPVSFAAKREALQANPGRPVDQSTTDTLRRNDRSQRPSFVRTASPGTSPQVYQPAQSSQPAQPVVRPNTPVMRDNNNPAQQQPPPVRNDRPVFRQQQQQPVQPQQNTPQQNTPQQPVQPQQQQQVQRPRFDRPPVQQQQPVQPQQNTPQQPVQQQPQVQRPQFDRPPVQPQQPTQPRQEVQQRQEHKQDQQQRKTDRKVEHKDDKKDEKKQ